MKNVRIFLNTIARVFQKFFKQICITNYELLIIPKNINGLVRVKNSDFNPNPSTGVFKHPRLLKHLFIYRIIIKMNNSKSRFNFVLSTLFLAKIFNGFKIEILLKLVNKVSQFLDFIFWLILAKVKFQIHYIQKFKKV